MINLKRKIFIFMMIVAVIFSLSGCYTPSPLYGTWMNNEGDTITFMSGEEQTFIASFYNATGAEVSYDGTWECRSNILVLTLEKPVSSASDSENSEGSEAESDEATEEAKPIETKTVTKLCEWDIRGDMLFLKWTDDYNEMRLISLYHVAK